MLRKESEAVSEGNGPVHQQEEFGFGQPVSVDEFREIKSHFDKLKELMRRLEQHFLSQEQDARQPLLAVEADETANTKTHERRRRAPLQQYKRCVGIAVLLHKGFNMAR